MCSAHFRLGWWLIINKTTGKEPLWKRLVKNKTNQGIQNIQSIANIPFPKHPG